MRPIRIERYIEGLRNTSAPKGHLWFGERVARDMPATAVPGWQINTGMEEYSDSAKAWHISPEYSYRYTYACLVSALFLVAKLVTELRLTSFRGACRQTP